MDVFEKTDFKLHARGRNGEMHLQFWISIQVKSSMAAAREFSRRYPDSKVHLVVMNGWMNIDRLKERLERIYDIEVKKITKPAPVAV